MPPATGSLRDSLGRSIQPPAQAKRIISLASSNTEILFALGLDAEIVGTTEFCTYPEAAKSKPRVGGFAPQTFNIEAIADLKPDLVLAAGDFHRPVIESLERLGITVAGFHAESIADIQQNVRTIGQLVGRSQDADRVVERMRASLNAVTQRVKDRPKPLVFYLVSDDPLMTAGAKSMISDAIHAAGGTNAFADLNGDYIRISDEEILKRNPSVILIPQFGHDGKTSAPRVLSSLDAVKANRVFAVDADSISRPSPRLIHAIEQIAMCLHPER